jgi:hypothetical protein
MATDKPKNTQALQRRYQSRFTNARLGREAVSRREYIIAIKNYNEYLKILADINGQEPLTLKPEVLDAEKELSELLLVSHIYWELTKIYDMTPKLQDEFSKVLNQFVVFTVNQPFQVVNAELLRKHMKRPTTSNYDELKAAYDKIFVESDGCFISSLCFSQNHFITNDLRLLKAKLNKSPFGLNLIKLYYFTSTKLIAFLKNKNLIRKLIIFITKPLLYIASRLCKFSLGGK